MGKVVFCLLMGWGGSKVWFGSGTGIKNIGYLGFWILVKLGNYYVNSKILGGPLDIYF